MKLSISFGLCLLAGHVLSEDMVCTSGKETSSVVLNAGDVFKFNTNGRKYRPNLDCSASYKLADDCPSAVVSCTKFNTKANKKCSKGDIFTVTDDNGSTRFCRKKGPKDFEVSGDFELKFTSDGRRQKTGLQCTVACSDDGSGSGSGSCVDCKTTTGGSCLFPFIYKNKAYYSCTTDDSDDGKPWCSTG